MFCMQQVQLKNLFIKHVNKKIGDSELDVNTNFILKEQIRLN